LIGHSHFISFFFIRFIGSEADVDMGNDNGTLLVAVLLHPMDFPQLINFNETLYNEDERSPRYNSGKIYAQEMQDGEKNEAVIGDIRY
jgi:hypothetical protein